MKRSLKDKIDELAVLSVPALAARYREVFQAEPPAVHRQFLFRKLAWRLQADKEGGLSREARELAAAIACNAPLRVRVTNNAARLCAGQALDRTATATVEPGHDSRLPMPGRLILKQYKGDTIVVKVTDDGRDERPRYAAEGECSTGADAARGGIRRQASPDTEREQARHGRRPGRHPDGYSVAVLRLPNTRLDLGVGVGVGLLRYLDAEPEPPV
jgi:hypothetical protein